MTTRTATTAVEVADTKTTTTTTTTQRLSTGERQLHHFRQYHPFLPPIQQQSEPESPPLENMKYIQLSPPSPPRLVSVIPQPEQPQSQQQEQHHYSPMEMHPHHQQHEQQRDQQQQQQQNTKSDELDADNSLDSLSYSPITHLTTTPTKTKTTVSSNNINKNSSNNNNIQQIQREQIEKVMREVAQEMNVKALEMLQQLHNQNQMVLEQLLDRVEQNAKATRKAYRLHTMITILLLALSGTIHFIFINRNPNPVSPSQVPPVTVNDKQQETVNWSKDNVLEEDTIIKRIELIELKTTNDETGEYSTNINQIQLEQRVYEQVQKTIDGNIILQDETPVSTDTTDNSITADNVNEKEVFQEAVAAIKNDNPIRLRFIAYTHVDVISFVDESNNGMTLLHYAVVIAQQDPTKDLSDIVDFLVDLVLYSEHVSIDQTTYGYVNHGTGVTTPPQTALDIAMESFPKIQDGHYCHPIILILQHAMRLITDEEFNTYIDSCDETDEEGNNDKETEEEVPDEGVADEGYNDPED